MISRFRQGCPWSISCSSGIPIHKWVYTSIVCFWLAVIISKITSILKLVGLICSDRYLASFIIFFNGLVLHYYKCTDVSYAAPPHTHNSIQGLPSNSLQYKPYCRPIRNVVLLSGILRSLVSGFRLPVVFILMAPFVIRYSRSIFIYWNYICYHFSYSKPKYSFTNCMNYRAMKKT